MGKPVRERVALKVKHLKKVQKEYLADCREYAEQGYRPQYCIHGTNQWTDYDNICWGCEDGDFTEYTRGAALRQLAEDLVHDEIYREREQARMDKARRESWTKLIEDTQPHLSEAQKAEQVLILMKLG